MSCDWPVWRSMLFVPAHVEKFVAGAHRHRADAYILDLEDSVPPAQKAPAREALDNSAALLGQAGAAVLVRINSERALIEEDLKVAVAPRIAALMLAKIESADEVKAIDLRVTEIEMSRKIKRGHTLLIAQIESVHALSHIDEIASSSSRLMGLTLGSEDFSVSAGMEPTPETLYGPNQQLVFACRRANLLPFGFPGSISVLRDHELLRKLICRAREMGFVGSYAIHPHQVTVMNELFAPSASEVEQARELLTAGEKALLDGRAAFEYNGRMIDPPVIARAWEILRRHGAVKHASVSAFSRGDPS